MSKNNLKTKENFNGLEYKEINNLTTGKVVRLLVVFAFILGFSVIFSFTNITNNKIAKNTYIQNINVSDMTQDEARNYIIKKYREKQLRNIKLNHLGDSTIVSYEQLNVTEKIEEAVKEAYLRGRKGNIISNNYSILFSKIFKKNYDANIKIDENALDNVVKDTESKLKDVVQEYSYYIENEKLIIKPGKDGVIIDKEKIKKEILDRIENLDEDNNEIDIPCQNSKAKEIDIEKIVSEIKKDAENAYISKDPVEIHIEKDGIDLAISVEEAKEIIKEEREEYEIPLKIIKPSITVASLGEDAFANKLSTFTTTYDASNINRNNNLVLAAQKLNGTIVNPGETFSYNKTIGERTIAAGFKEAKAYANGDIVLDVGGGICQLSSTLYNACLLTNLDIVERYNHSFTTSYVSPSRDATVSWGTLDYKFKNNRKYPIKIEATAGDGVVVVNIYGIKQEDDYTVLIDSKVTSIIERKEEHKKSGTPRNGEDGCTSEAYKTLLKNGVIVSKTVISRDTYNALSKIVID